MHRAQHNVGSHEGASAPANLYDRVRHFRRFIVSTANHLNADHWSRGNDGR
jgi:hypothetical protein